MESFYIETPEIKLGDHLARIVVRFKEPPKFDAGSMCSGAIDRKPLMQRLRERLCSWFGHSYDPVDVLVFRITSDAIAGPQPKIKCRSCGQEFVRK